MTSLRELLFDMKDPSIGTVSTTTALFGNLTAVFSLLFDNLVNLLSLLFIIASGGASTDDISSNLYVGSLSGVIIGNLVICYLTKSGQIPLRTSVPFGIDAPSVFFIAYALLDIYIQKINDGASLSDALRDTWANGTAIVLTMGLVKLGLTILYYFYDFPRHINKQAYAGALAGIGIALLGMNNLIGIFEEPCSGLVSLFVLLMVTLPDPRPNDWKNYVPHFLWSVLIGVPIYYIILAVPLESGAVEPTFFYALPRGDYMGQYAFDGPGQKYFVQSVSYAFLVWFSGYSVVKVALVDDAIETGVKISVEEEKRVVLKVLLLDSLCTITGSILGGIVQTTPYIGYNTYKKLKADTNYSWIFAGLLILLSVTGSITYLADALPQPVLKPIFVLIALHIAEFAFGVDSSIFNEKQVKDFNKAIPATVMALFPALAQLMSINGNTSDSVILLSSGFVLTSILWVQVTINIIYEERLKVFFFFVCLSALTFFGLIHSYDGEVYYDAWNHGSPLPVYVSLAYLLCALLSLVFVPGIPSDEDQRTLELKRGSLNPQTTALIDSEGNAQSSPLH